MDRYPFFHDFQTARTYYGPALTGTETPQELWTSEEQREIVPSSDALWNTIKFGAITGAIGASGFLSYEDGNLWDKYIGIARSAEEYSPGGVLRTFQLSNVLSPLSSKVLNADLFITPELLQHRSNVHVDYLSKLIGGDGTRARLLSEGVTFREGKLFWGQGDQVALKHASAITSAGFGTAQRIGASYAKILNVDSPFALEHFFSSPTHQGQIVNPVLEGEAALIIGGQTRRQSAYRYAGAIGTELVERFNRLLDVPFETAPFSTIFGRGQKFLAENFGIKLKLGVESTGGLRTLGKLSLKYGVAAAGIGLGYQTLDWMTRRSSLFDNTLLDEGLTVAGATIGVQTNLAASKVADVFGLHDYREKQEEIAPGSTSLQKLLAFPLMGMAAPAIGMYGIKVSRMRELTKNGMAPAQAREAVEASLAKWEGGETLERIGKAIATDKGYYSEDNFFGGLIRSLSKPDKEGRLIYKGVGHLTPLKAATAAGAMAGIALISPFLPGALLPSQRPEELEALYSGQQEVAVRKGRWWTFGRTPYEGNQITHFRPHWYARMRMRAREKGIYGANEDELSPMQKLWKREFTYELEEEHFHDRPFPQTALPFEDVPLIGPLLANTVGRLIKPSRLMHQEEWMRGDEVKAEPLRFGERVATEIGESPVGVPVSPYSASQVAGEQMYRLTEMVGLPGFISGAIKGQITGREEWFDQVKQLETSRRMFGIERQYWDQELGDMLGTNEALRRLYPHRRRQIDLYNNIRNTMPEWTPGPGDKSPDFWHGDPFTKVVEGELRLPGLGYEARYPELKGTSPKDYPLMHKYRILADIAPYSDAFNNVSAQVSMARKNQQLSEQEEAMYAESNRQLDARKNKEFQEYKYLSPIGKIGGSSTSAYTSQVLAEINKQQASGEKPSLFRKLFGGYWEALSHNAETAADQLTPIAPGAKLVHERSSIESYERQMLYGQENAFWQHPVRDFIAPFFRSVGHAFGNQDVPDRIQHIRDMESYFDVLKYTKYTRLANMARTANDTEAVTEFEKQKDQTLFGMNPFTRSFGNILKALPRKERDYFKAFGEADTIEERTRIMEMVPDNEKALYLARWKLMEADQLIRAKKAGILSDKQIEAADNELNAFYEEAKSEGFPTSTELFAEYTKTRQEGENYADWYRRTYLLPKVDNIPGPDWVGWHPSVDLEDIKLKVIQTLGEDMHDYNLWSSREKLLPYKPYIDNEAIEPILNREELSKEEIQSRINKVLTAGKIKGDVFIRRSIDGKDSINMELEEDRSKDMENALMIALK